MANDERDDTNAQDAQDATEPGENGQVPSSVSRLLDKDFLIPVAATAATAAAVGLAASKGGDIKNKLVGMTKETAQELGREGAAGAKQEITGGNGVLGALAGGAAKLIPGKGGGGSSKKTRRLPIQRWTDIAVPVDVAYEKWTKFDDFPKFMHRVLKAEQEDDGTVTWEEKIWFSRREWKGEITDQRKNDRIAWKTVSGTSHTGVVSFHSLDDSLTRVLVTVDFEPAGMIEKMASGLRFAKRAVQADLARFKAYAELGEAKGLDYAAAPAEKETEQGERRGRGAKSESNGDDEPEDNEERDAERREREQRREERREAVPAG